MRTRCKIGLCIHTYSKFARDAPESHMKGHEAILVGELFNIHGRNKGNAPHQPYHSAMQKHVGNGGGDGDPPKKICTSRIIRKQSGPRVDPRSHTSTAALLSVNRTPVCPADGRPTNTARKPQPPTHELGSDALQRDEPTRRTPPAAKIAAHANNRRNGGQLQLDRVDRRGGNNRRQDPSQVGRKSTHLYFLLF